MALDGLLERYRKNGYKDYKVYDKIDVNYATRHGFYWGLLAGTVATIFVLYLIGEYLDIH